MTSDTKCHLDEIQKDYIVLRAGTKKKLRLNCPKIPSDLYLLLEKELELSNIALYYNNLMIGWLVVRGRNPSIDFLVNSIKDVINGTAGY